MPEKWQRFSGMTPSADDWAERAGKERIRWTDPLPNLPLPEVEVSGVRLFVFLHTSTRSAADLFERLTAIVETTTATFERHLETRV